MCKLKAPESRRCGVKRGVGGRGRAPIPDLYTVLDYGALGRYPPLSEPACLSRCEMVWRHRVCFLSHFGGGESPQEIPGLCPSLTINSESKQLVGQSPWSC